jgi:hypothetical protein
MECIHRRHRRVLFLRPRERPTRRVRPSMLLRSRRPPKDLLFASSLIRPRAERSESFHRDKPRQRCRSLVGNIQSSLRQQPWQFSRFCPTMIYITLAWFARAGLSLPWTASCGSSSRNQCMNKFKLTHIKALEALISSHKRFYVLPEVLLLGMEVCEFWCRRYLCFYCSKHRIIISDPKSISIAFP